MSGKRKVAQVAAAGIGTALGWDDRPLHKILEEVERKLKGNGAGAAGVEGRDLVISRLVLPGCAYIVSRIATAGVESLSPRQRQVAELVLVKCLSRKEAALRLGLSHGTLRTHLDRIYRKFDSPASMRRQLSLLG